MEEFVNENDKGEATTIGLEGFVEEFVEENDVEIDIVNGVSKDCNEEMVGLIGNDGCQDKLSKLLMPCKGTEFNSIEEAYFFYNRYAKVRGFGTRNGTSHYSRRTNAVYRKSFVCEKEGTKRTDDPRQRGKDVKRRADTREQCKANMVIKVNDRGKWVVEIFNDMHSHELSSPSKVSKIRSHKKLTLVSKKLMDELYDCGIGPSKISRVLNHTSGAIDEGEFTYSDCKNHLLKSRKNNIGRQCMKVLEYFQKKVGIEEGFFFKMEVDENVQVRSVFWADNRSRMAYMHFGDVVVFDVTYNTNSFSMPFAPFTGINHHRQSTLFGCALLADETTSTFTWLFETWLECMWGKEPQCIITDQDIAMKKAISKVFPNTRHRYCSWHVGMNGMMHLNQLGKHVDFNKDYNDWVYAETVEDSEAKWIELKEKYDIKEGSWLDGMYKVREHWINAYLKDYFFAGMTSSQRSESINAFFDGFVNAQTPISEFVKQYDIAIHARRQEEAYEDHKTLHTKSQMHVGNKLEEYARSIYTRKIFTLFQEELKQSLLYKCKELGGEGLLKIYEVKRNLADEKHQIVTFKNKPEIVIDCTCKKFEGEGILCRHVLRIFFQMDVDIIPEKYVLFRWTINARYASSATLKTVSETQTSTISPNMIYSFRSAMYRISNLVCLSPQHWGVAMPMLKDVVDELDRLSLKSSSEMEQTIKSNDEGGPTAISRLDLDQIPQIMLRDPMKVKSKGRPKTCKRMKSSLELGMSSQVKKRKCGLCHKLGHYMNTCSLYKEKESQQENTSIQS